MMLRRVMAGFLVVCALVFGPPEAQALEPVDPALIPEARKLLDYLESVYGKKTLAGMSSYGGWKPVFEMCGRAPAVYSVDAFGWNKPKFGPSYRRVLQGAIDTCHNWWHVRGGVVAMQFHWGKPGDPNGSAWVRGGKGTGLVDVGKTVTPGTPEHQAAMDDLSKTADYLEQLAKEKVPVLWRPLHEIDGGWFWWTDKDKPENTAALWRMMFNYFVKERGLHNLVWVFNPAHVAHGAPKDASSEEQLAYRKRFYPGDDHVDLAGIDVYPNPNAGWGSPEEDTYERGFQMMQQIAPGKMVALCECAALPNPDLLEKNGPGWLYCLPWFAGGKPNPPEWIRKTFPHKHMLTLDELPALVPHNVAPNVRITEPTDGAEIQGSSIEFHGVATDRNGNLSRVEIYQLAEPWRNWFLKKDGDMEEALSKATRLGEPQVGPDGRWTFTASGIPPDCGNFVAVARDAADVVGLSNVVRLTVGMRNLARGQAATASSDGDSAVRAIDGDLFTMWSSAKEDPQWLAVNLGSTQKVGGVIVAWWKAYARSYEIQVSTDSQNWQVVHREGNKRGYAGDSDVIRFEPRHARHIRLYATERGTNWGGYSVYELSVFTSIPEPPNRDD